MKRRLFVTMLFALVAAVAIGPSGARQAAANDPPKVNAVQELTMLTALGEPALDPVADPPGNFHRVKPIVFDPGKTHLVQSTWLDGIGCPTNAFTATPNADFSAWSGATAPYTDAACPSTAADLKDKHNEGLLLVKTGPSTPNFAAATAQLTNVKGMTLTELGYDIRKIGVPTPTGSTDDPRGSHCDGGSPRFDILAQDGTFYFLACNSPVPTTQSASGMGFTRLRWGTVAGVLAYCVNPTTTPTASCPADFSLVPVNGPVKSITIVFDEGQDFSGPPDFFGGAILDNIDVNNTLVGRGAPGNGMAEDQSNDDDDDD